MNEPQLPNAELGDMARQLLGKKPEQHRTGAAAPASPGAQPAKPQAKFTNLHHPEVYAKVRKHIQNKIKSLGG